MKISPNYNKFSELYSTLMLTAEKPLDELVTYEERLDNNPQARDYLNLSLRYYKLGEYQRCISACKKALRLKPDYAHAYNNICSAYNEMSEWEKAEDACRKALKINPDYQRARNNLQIAVSGNKQIRNEHVRAQ